MKFHTMFDEMVTAIDCRLIPISGIRMWKGNDCGKFTVYSSNWYNYVLNPVN